MKTKGILLLPLLFALFACQNKPEETSSTLSGVAIGEVDSFTMVDKANYFWNLRKSEFEEDGIPSKTNNLLFASQEITPPCQLIPPETNPTRTGYDFAGWYTEPECQTRFDFVNTQVETSLNLFAGWTRVGGDEYIEPPYSEPVKIDDTLETPIALEGILHRPISDDTVFLTLGGLNRLKENPTDCRFAVNASFKTGAKIDSAVYDDSLKTLTINASLASETLTKTITIRQSAEPGLVLDNSTYENKAVAYENADQGAENGHIMLAGSSSMEFWTNYKNALDPIVAYNHGIGGTTSAQWRDSLIERLVVPYCPKAVVYYVGVNDIINNGKTAEETIASTKEVLEKTHERLPNCHVFYVLINVLPGYYLPYEQDIRTVGAAMNQYASDLTWLDNIDAGASLMKASGAADKAYFRLDNLHMSEYGYVLWG
ncbi:MAG: InlB B-repeat-containing protein, partial [Bacilli bacterium]|nr:InlB B-repeat-containing protein [Bacilli bacterium]